MVKSVLKEICIILLLSVAILLILGIIFYEYIPINQTVPTREAYVTSENVKAEIDENIKSSEKIEVTYEITDSDLNIYKQSGSYTEGKVNPFLLEPETQNNTDTNTNNNGGNTNNGNDNNENEQNDVDRNSTGTFFNEEGIK